MNQRYKVALENPDADADQEAYEAEKKTGKPPSHPYAYDGPMNNAQRQRESSKKHNKFMKSQLLGEWNRIWAKWGWMMPNPKKFVRTVFPF